MRLAFPYGRRCLQIGDTPQKDIWCLVLRFEVLIEDEEEAAAQALRMAQKGEVIVP